MILKKIESNCVYVMYVMYVCNNSRKLENQENSISEPIKLYLPKFISTYSIVSLFICICIQARIVILSVLNAKFEMNCVV